jgi:hypothetical protein
MTSIFIEGDGTPVTNIAFMESNADCSLESVQLIELTRDGICGIINDQLEGFKDSGFPILFK